MWHKKQKPTKPKVSQAQHDWLAMELVAMRELNAGVQESGRGKKTLA